MSMNHWLGWGNRTVWWYFLSFIMVLVSIKKERVHFDFCRKNILLCLLLYLTFMFVQLRWTGNPLDTKLYTHIPKFLLPSILIICIPKEYKSVILRNISKWFAFLLMPAIITFILSRFVDLPSLGVLRYDTEDLTNQYGVVNNLFFCVIPQAAESQSRFYGPFLEPGHLGMMCSLLLFANGHNYSRKENVVILISLILTLSLAGYVLCLIGFFFIRFDQGKLKLYRIIIYSLLLLGFVVVGRYYHGGNNIINEMIISRLEPDEERGIAGNNRDSEVILLLYADMFNNPRTMLMGYDVDTIEAAGKFWASGFAYFMVRKGLLGLIAASLFYFAVALSSDNKKFAILALVYFAIMFWQRTYSFWLAWIICYEYSISIAGIRAKARLRKRKGKKKDKVTKMHNQKCLANG